MLMLAHSGGRVKGLPKDSALAAAMCCASVAEEADMFMRSFLTPVSS